MPAAVLHGVLAEQLGPGWRDRFETFEEHPAAAASIGQVHRATWHDGTPVAVKVQYPGAAQALTADLRQLDRFAPLARLGAPGMDVRQLFAQLRERLVEELDYEHEAEAQRAFGRGFAGDPDIAIPQVVDVRRQVLVTTWVDGRPLADVIASGSQQERDAAGRNLLRLLLSSPHRAGRVHGDPHPGNFRLLPDGRLAVLDFGSSEPAARDWSPALGRLLRAGAGREADELHGRAVSAGLIDSGDIDPVALCALMDPWLEPLRVRAFHFERAWLQREVRSWSDPRGPGARLQRKVHIPTRHLLVQRVAFGLLGVLTSLDATVPVREEVERWVPGFGDDDPPDPR